ncbi:MAG: YkgJ family cysteine cluster protein [Thermodesulfobacteriota bacterium]
MKDELLPIGQDESFQFECTSRTPCFNECCRDLNQFVTPYDILRLKNGLGIPSTEFLERFTRQHIGPETGLPVVTLRSQDSTENTCPFVTSAGCRLYADRPGSCRMYPLARMISRSRETGVITEHYAILQESHCRGFENSRRQTVREWIETQGLREYNEMNDRMMDILRHKNRLSPGSSLSLADKQLFQTACYDIDRFRVSLLERALTDSAEWNDISPERLQTDDIALLRFSMQWIRRTLFGSP